MLSGWNLRYFRGFAISSIGGTEEKRLSEYIFMTLFALRYKVSQITAKLGASSWQNKLFFGHLLQWKNIVMSWTLVLGFCTFFRSFLVVPKSFRHILESFLLTCFLFIWALTVLLCGLRERGIEYTYSIYFLLPLLILFRFSAGKRRENLCYVTLDSVFSFAKVFPRSGF